MLHMGHMLNNTLQDVLAPRPHVGQECLLGTGMDHASIATEAKVVAMLHEKGIENRRLA
ncbi:MAG: class I tRNA ligase family protein [Alistipes finegoldii]